MCSLPGRLDQNRTGGRAFAPPPARMPGSAAPRRPRLPRSGRGHPVQAGCGAFRKSSSRPARSKQDCRLPGRAACPAAPHRALCRTPAPAVPSVPKGARYPISVRLPVPPCCDLVFLHFIQLSVYREQGVIVQCTERFELFCANGARHPAALPVLPFCHISFKFSVLPVPPKGNCRIKQKRQLSKAVFFVVQECNPNPNHFPRMQLLSLLQR